MASAAPSPSASTSSALAYRRVLFRKTAQHAEDEQSADREHPGDDIRKEAHVVEEAMRVAQAREPQILGEGEIEQRVRAQPLQILLIAKHLPRAGVKGLRYGERARLHHVERVHAQAADQEKDCGEAEVID